jgi:hypothetical protein
MCLRTRNCCMQGSVCRNVVSIETECKINLGKNLKFAPTNDSFSLYYILTFAEKNMPLGYVFTLAIVISRTLQIHSVRML